MKARLLISVFALLLGGCLVVPHLEQRSPQVSGTVVDATTKQPIQDVRVEFVDNPSLAGLTLPNGEFVIAATKKPELFTPADYSLGEKIVPRLRITCAGYVTATVDASKRENLYAAKYAVPPTEAQLVEGPLYLKPIELQKQPAMHAAN